MQPIARRPAAWSARPRCSTSTAPARPADIAAGERSLAVRLELLDDDATLTDERIEADGRRGARPLNQRLGVRLRA